MRSPLSGPVDQPETLADVLASSPLSLAAGLRCAVEIATELRDLHQATRAYGKLTACSIVMTESGAHPLPLRHYSQPGLTPANTARPQSVKTG